MVGDRRINVAREIVAISTLARTLSLQATIICLPLHTSLYTTPHNFTLHSKMSAAHPTYIPTAAEAAITALIEPLRQEIAQFKREFRELDRQFNRLLMDPHRCSKNPDEQFMYKRALVSWYHEGLPRAINNLHHRLMTFWTAAPVGMAWMEVYERQRKQNRGRAIGTVKAIMDQYAPEVLKMEESIPLLFQDMEELSMLNPGWKGARKFPLFVQDGSVITVDPTGPIAAVWIPFMEH